MESYEIQDMLAAYPQREESVVEILHDIQLRYRHLPRQTLGEVAQYCGVALSQVMSVATFYKAFSLQRKGDTVIKVCVGTACHVKGASRIVEEAERVLGCRCGETTKDGKYTLEEVSCVGACAMAPLVIENEKYHGKFKPVDMKKLLKTGE
jgi:NADH:ubiquinone oxidoreductase subunit E